MVSVAFDSPIYLWLFVGVFLVVITHFIDVGWSRKKGISFANYALIQRVVSRKLFPRSSFQFIMKVVALSLIILGLAEMVIWYEGFGTDSNVVFAIDASASMLANDYNPTRLDVAKETSIELVSRANPGVKIGVIAFAGTSIIVNPLTNDKFSLRDSIRGINIIKTGGTAIGEAILLGSNILSSIQDSKGKTLILVTDGQNNVGLSPDDATKYANDNGIIIHTIGIGTEEGGKFSAASTISQLDQINLRRISESTGGRYYHPLSKEELQIALIDIFNSGIVKIGVNARTQLILVAVFILLIEWILANTRYRVRP